MTQSYDKETCTVHPQAALATSVRISLAVLVCGFVLGITGWLFTDFVSVFAKTIAVLFGLGV